MMLSEVSGAAVIGGAERVLREQASGLQRAGHEVRLVVRQPPGDARATVSIGEVREWRYPVTRTSEAAFVVSSLRGSLRVFDEARAHAPIDAVIIHQSLAGLAPILFRKHVAGTWVYLCLSLAHEEYRSRLQTERGNTHRLRQAMNAGMRRWIENRVMQRCDRVAVLSDFTWRGIQTVHGLPDHRLAKLPGAADLDRFRPAENRAEIRHALKLPTDKFVLFTVRNLVPRMGLDNLIKAIHMLGEEERGIEVLIGGEGPQRPALEREIRALGLADKVQLLGFVPEELLPKYYQASDLVLMPTQELEGFGLVTVEALACGTPVLGTPVGAIPEVLGRLDPLLVAEGSDSHSLARGIRQILRVFREQPAERERLATQGRALVESRYTWQAQTEAMVALIQTLCPRTGT